MLLWPRMLLALIGQRYKSRVATVIPLPTWAHGQRPMRNTCNRLHVDSAKADGNLSNFPRPATEDEDEAEPGRGSLNAPKAELAIILISCAGVA